MKSSNSNEVGPTGTTRTAGTADTTHQTFETVNNSHSIRATQSGQPVLKPPRNAACVNNSMKQNLNQT